jgi:pimeloyl-ACP methyl ester carboxylesterase
MKKALAILLIILAILIASCKEQQLKAQDQHINPLPRENNQDAKSLIKEVDEKEDIENPIADVSLTTEDNVQIKATFYQGQLGMPSMILAHMLNGQRHDWGDFALQMQKLGYNLIAIDLRGHGESELKWQDFSEFDFNKMVFDLKAANEYLKRKGLSDKVVAVGASVGANAAINFAANDDIDAAILLSPSLDYRGLKTEGAIISYNKPTLIVTSQDDSYSYESSKKLDEISEATRLIVYGKAAHGTHLFKATDIDKVIAGWLESNLE